MTQLRNLAAVLGGALLRFGHRNTRPLPVVVGHGHRSAFDIEDEQGRRNGNLGRWRP